MVELPTADKPVVIVEGDCLDVLRAMPDGCVDAVVTDPPYGLVEPRSNGNGSGCAFAPRSEHAKEIRRGGFMGKKWDADVPDASCWELLLKLTKPGGYLAAFGGSRTVHRLACAIEDAGWEIRDQILYMYGTGFPKGKGCLKPAYEPIILARRPGPKVLPLGIDECRVPASPWKRSTTTKTDIRGGRLHAGTSAAGGKMECDPQEGDSAGRWPANVIHDGSEEVLEAFPDAPGQLAPSVEDGKPQGNQVYGKMKRGGPHHIPRQEESKSAARFFYCAKASKSDRGEGNNHPTVKPTSLMSWLVKLVATPGSLVLDPFAGSGTTGKACQMEGRRCLLVEREAEYVEIIRRRLFSAPPANPRPSLFDD